MDRGHPHLTSTELGGAIHRVFIESSYWPIERYPAEYWEARDGLGNLRSVCADGNVALNQNSPHPRPFRLASDFYVTEQARKNIGAGMDMKIDGSSQQLPGLLLQDSLVGLCL
jgi:hypothetical protein